MDLDADERQEYLDLACSGDAGLRTEVEELLSADENPPTVLDRDAASFVAPVWGEDGTAVRFVEGAELGSYRLLREIGRGGMSRVFLAERTDRRFDRKVAVKILSTTGWKREELEPRFHAEGRVLGSLSHPNIAQVFDAGVDGQGHPYLVIEFVDGAAITEHCAARDLSVEDRLELFLDVCRAVQHAHQRLIVHRDLKPSNILVDHVGQVKLLDFGIAKLLDSPDQPPGIDGEALTKTGFLPMTPEYAAPEQFQGREITTATDIYTLGLLLFELLTGSRPYNLGGRSPSEIERLVCHDEPPKPSLEVLNRGDDRSHHLGRELRGDLDTIVLKALRKEPEARYGSVEALAHDLQNYRNGLPIDARPASVGYRAGRFVRRHRLGVAFTLLVFVGLMAFGTTMARQKNQMALERDRTRVEKDRAEHLTEFLLGLFAASNPSEALGEETTARELLERGAQKISEMDHDPIVKARMLDVLGSVNGKLGNLEEAASLLRQAIEIERAASADETLALANMQDHLAAVLIQQSDYEAAESLLRSTLEIRRRLLGPDHVDVASNLNNLAVALKEQDREAEAESLHREALSIRRLALGSDHPDVAESLVNLGDLLHASGRYDEAEPMLRDGVRIFRVAYGPIHPRIANAVNAHANLLARVGRYSEAEPLLREALDLRLQLYGSEHHLVSKSLNDLAVFLRNRGDFQAAVPFFEQALRSYENLLGPDHLAVAIVANNLAGVLVLGGDFDRAEAHCRRSLEISEMALGSSNRYAVTALTGLGTASDGRGDFVQAERYYREAAEMARQLFGNDHPKVAGPQVELGRLLVKTGRASEAKPLLREAERVFYSAFGGDHPASARARMWLAGCLDELGETDEAKRMLSTAYEVQRKALPPEHPHLVETERALAEMTVIG